MPTITNERERAYNNTINDDEEWAPSSDGMRLINDLQREKKEAKPRKKNKQNVAILLPLFVCLLATFEFVIIISITDMQILYI